MTDEKDLEVSETEDAQEQEALSPEESALNGGEDAAQPEAESEQEILEGLPGDEMTPDNPDKVVSEGDASEDDAEAAMLAMLEDLPDEEPGATPDDIDFGTAEVSSAEFQQLSEPATSASDSNIDMLMDVDLPVAIELGRTKMSISDILALGPGSVVELNKLAGEPVDLLVNYKVVARGEVVVVDENFGLRITQLLTPEERLKSLAKE